MRITLEDWWQTHIFASKQPRGNLLWQSLVDEMILKFENHLARF